MPTEADVLAKLDLLITMVRDVQIEQRIMKDSQAHMGERIARMEGRLDEQSRILTALIPNRIAAVPPAAE